MGSLAACHQRRRRVGHPHQGHHCRRRCDPSHPQVPDRQEGRRTHGQKGLKPSPPNEKQIFIFFTHKKTHAPSPPQNILIFIHIPQSFSSFSLTLKFSFFNKGRKKNPSHIIPSSSYANLKYIGRFLGTKHTTYVEVFS